MGFIEEHGRMALIAFRLNESLGCTFAAFCALRTRIAVAS